MKATRFVSGWGGRGSLDPEHARTTNPSYLCLCVRSFSRLLSQLMVLHCINTMLPTNIHDVSSQFSDTTTNLLLHPGGDSGNVIIFQEAVHARSTMITFFYPSA